MQSVRADRIVLWISKGETALLPPNVLALRGAGLEIRECADLGSFKKIVPALRAWPRAFIVTADDDVYYPRHWLRDLLRAYDPRFTRIPCHRAHRVALSADGSPRSYRKWKPARPGETSPLVFPTGVGGVLYPPGSLHDDATREDLFGALCPTSDDAWVFWMAQLNGWRFKRVSGMSFVCWPGSQVVALQNRNVAGENDRQIVKLSNQYGFPASAAANWRLTPVTEAHQW
jgi:hypothetical protein